MLILCNFFCSNRSKISFDPIDFYNQDGVKGADVIRLRCRHSVAFFASYQIG